MLSRCPRYAPRVINVVFHKIVEQSLSYRTICRRNPGIIFEILSLVVSAPVPIVIQPGGNIGVRQAGVVHILINRWGPVFRAVPSPHIFLHVRYHKNSLFNPKTYGNMRLIRSILTRYCIITKRKRPPGSRRAPALPKAPPPRGCGSGRRSEKPAARRHGLRL